LRGCARNAGGLWGANFCLVADRASNVRGGRRDSSLGPGRPSPPGGAATAPHRGGTRATIHAPVVAPARARGVRSAKLVRRRIPGRNHPTSNVHGKRWACSWNWARRNALPQAARIRVVRQFFRRRRVYKPARPDLPPGGNPLPDGKGCRVMPRRPCLRHLKACPLPSLMPERATVEQSPSGLSTAVGASPLIGVRNHGSESTAGQHFPRLCRTPCARRAGPRKRVRVNTPRAVGDYIACSRTGARARGLAAAGALSPRPGASALRKSTRSRRQTATVGGTWWLGAEKGAGFHARDHRGPRPMFGLSVSRISRLIGGQCWGAPYDCHAIGRPDRNIRWHPRLGSRPKGACKKNCPTWTGIGLAHEPSDPYPPRI